MAYKFTPSAPAKSYSAPSGVAGPVSSRSATAADFGGSGEGLKAVAKGLTDFSTVLKEREDKRSITSARAQFSKFQVGFARSEIERQQNTDIGDQNYFQESVNSWDTGLAKITDGWNPVQKDAMAALTSSSRTTHLNRSLVWQSGNIVKGDMQVVENLRLSINTRLFNGDITMQEAVDEFSNALIDTTIPPVDQGDLSMKALPGFREAIGVGFLKDLASSQRGLLMIEKGELSDWPGEERVKLKESVISNINSANTKAKNQRLARSLAKNSAAFELLQGPGGGAALHELEGMKDTMTSEVYDFVKKALVDIPYRTPDEQSTAQGELIARYGSIKRKKKDGMWTSKSELREILELQTWLAKQISEGYIKSGYANSYKKVLEEMVQRKIADDDFGDFSPFWKTDTYTFEHATDLIQSHVDENGLSVPDHSDILRRVTSALGKSNITEGAEQNKTRDDEIKKIVKQAISDHALEKSGNQYLSILTTAPAATMGKNGDLTLGPRGGDTKIPTNRDGNVIATDGSETNLKLERFDDGYQIRAFKEKDGSYSYWEYSKDASGNIIEGTKNLVNKDKYDNWVGTIKAPAPEIVSTKDDAEDSSAAHSASSLKPSDKAIEIVSGGLMDHEGIGDDVTGIPTGEGGITHARRKEIEERAERSYTDKEAREIAVRDDSSALHNNMTGFKTLSGNVQAAVLDLAYNIGVANILDVTKFRNLHNAIAVGKPKEILHNTLDTAIVDGKSVKGLAVRRAYMFNQANSDPKLRITGVEQLEDGTINYMTGTPFGPDIPVNVFASFKHPRHESSEPGMVKITNMTGG